MFLYISLCCSWEQKLGVTTCLRVQQTKKMYHSWNWRNFRRKNWIIQKFFIYSLLQRFACWKNISKNLSKVCYLSALSKWGECAISRGGNSQNDNYDKNLKNRIFSRLLASWRIMALYLYFNIFRIKL